MNVMKSTMSTTRLTRTLPFLLGTALFLSPSVTAAQQPIDEQQPQPRFEERVDVKPGIPSDVVRGSRFDYFFHFSAPVRVQDVTLAPDTYLFRFPLGPGTDIIQVLSADRSQVLTTFNTISAKDVSRDLSSGAEVVLAPQGPQAPMALTQIFLPGRSLGHELLYTDPMS